MKNGVRSCTVGGSSPQNSFLHVLLKWNSRFKNIPKMYWVWRVLKLKEGLIWGMDKNVKFAGFKLTNDVKKLIIINLLLTVNSTFHPQLEIKNVLFLRANILFLKNRIKFNELATILNLVGSIWRIAIFQNFCGI